MEEVWKEVEGYENYEVSNMGRVRSVDREVYQEGIGIRKLKGRTVKPWNNGNGYYKVCLGSYRTPDGKRKHPTEFVHRLVAKAFLDNPNNFKDVDHINYDRADNRVSNLRWVTRRDNIRHSLPNQPLTIKAAKLANTGHKYITKRVQTRYEVNVPISRGSRVVKSFKDLDTAIKWRNEKLKDIGVACDDN